MRKKLLYVVLCVLLCAAIGLYAYAVGGSLTITASKSEIKTGELVEVTFTVRNTTAGSIELPVHFNADVVKVANADGSAVESGLKTAAQARNGSAGLIIGEALNGAVNGAEEPLYWNGAIFSNPAYPYLDNERGMYRLRFENTENRAIGEETLITIRFIGVSAGSADIRAMESGDPLYSELFLGGFLYRVFPERETDAAGAFSFEVESETIRVSGASVTPPSGGGGGSGGGGATVVVKPEAAPGATFEYDVTERTVDNALARAEAETDNVLRIKIESDGSYSEYIIRVPVSAVRNALSKYVFSMEFETALGVISFDNSAAVGSMTASSEYVICTLTAQTRSVTIDGVAFGAAEQGKQPRTGFVDLPASHWAYEYVMSLASVGIVSGVGGDRFEPESNVTREQFAKMLVIALGLNGVGAESAFTDVRMGDWSYEYVSSAAEAGIITGYGDGSFGAGRNITRQEMAVMVGRAGLELPEVNAAAEFSDSGSIAAWAKDAVAAMQRAGVISGFTDSSFKPNDSATRAQAAKIICALITE